MKDSSLYEFNYDEIYGVDITEYCSAHNTSMEDIIKKIKIDINLLKNRLQDLIYSENFDKTLDYRKKDFLITVIFNLIKKKEAHLERIKNWEIKKK